MPFENSVGPIHGADRQRVGINAHLLSGEAGYRRAGIHQYIIQNLRHLPREVDGPEYILYTNHVEAEGHNQSALSIVHSCWPTERRLVRIAWEQLVWPIQAMRAKIDLLHSMAFVTPWWSPCPTVVTVYDLSFIQFPDRFPALQRWYLTSQTRRSCRQARRVIAISESGRQDVHQFFGVPLEQIDVVRPGVDSCYQPLPVADIAAFRRRENLPEKFVLHVGTLQPRKNLSVLLEAFAGLDRPDLQLVLVGGRGWLFDEIFQRVTRLGLQKRVRFAGYVPDQDLPLWYNAAALFVFPSLYEGFGMPVVEAMACGTPVIAANTSSIPEAAGEAAILFEPQDVTELAERMDAVLDDPALLTKMHEQGLLQAQQFSWQRAGRETAAVYRKALLQR
jgi:glycosyltransferase involved in cell wall biosynthesis